MLYEQTLDRFKKKKLNCKHTNKHWLNWYKNDYEMKCSLFIRSIWQKKKYNEIHKQQNKQKKK